MHKCNKCYHKPNNQEGCFTNDVLKLIKSKVPPCLDGTWPFFNPYFIKIELEDIK
jgi:hypothetical protein